MICKLNKHHLFHRKRLDNYVNGAGINLMNIFLQGGSFVSAQNKDFYQEEQQRLAEEHLQEAADIGRTSGIPLEKLIELLMMFYQEE